MSFSKQAQDAIDRWKTEAWRAEEERSLAVERLMERTAERDRARATAVAFEQQLAQVEHEMRDLQARYERRDESEFSGESSAALDAVQDCVTTVETVTDELTGDVFEANHPVPLAQAREGTA